MYSITSLVVALVAPVTSINSLEASSTILLPSTAVTVTSVVSSVSTSTTLIVVMMSLLTSWEARERGDLECGIDGLDEVCGQWCSIQSGLEVGSESVGDDELRSEEYVISVIDTLLPSIECEVEGICIDPCIGLFVICR